MRRSRSSRPRVSATLSATGRASPGIGSVVRSGLSSMTVRAMKRLYSLHMLERPCQKVSIILQREAVESRWEDHRWSLHGVVPDVGGEVRTILQTERLVHRLYPGFDAVLYNDEAEGHYLNASSEAPS